MRTATRNRESFRPGPGLEVEGRSVLVVGAARTGIEAANFLARRGAAVTLTDVKNEESLKEALQHLIDQHLT